MTLTETQWTSWSRSIFLACMKLHRSVHTDRDALTIEFHGVGIESDSANVNEPKHLKTDPLSSWRGYRASFSSRRSLSWSPPTYCIGIWRSLHHSLRIYGCSCFQCGFPDLAFPDLIKKIEFEVFLTPVIVFERQWCRNLASNCQSYLGWLLENDGPSADLSSPTPMNLLATSMAGQSPCHILFQIEVFSVIRLVKNIWGAVILRTSECESHVAFKSAVQKSKVLFCRPLTTTGRHCFKLCLSVHGEPI